jgi:hypothetical protein
MFALFIHRGVPILIAVACVVASCNGDRAPASNDTVARNRHDAAPARRYGYLVVPGKVTNLGLEPGDTLDELAPSGALRALADPSGHPVGTWLGPFDNRCTRYFVVSSAQYLVVQYQAFCSENATWIFDNPTSFVLFKTDSTGAFRYVDQEDLRPSHVEPPRRAIDGRPIQVGQKPQPR